MGLKISSKPSTRRLLFFEEMSPITFHLICPVNGRFASFWRVYPMAGKTQTQERTLLVSISQTQVLNSSDLLVIFLGSCFTLVAFPTQKGSLVNLPTISHLLHPWNSTWKSKFRISKKGVSFSKGSFSGSMLELSGSTYYHHQKWLKTITRGVTSLQLRIHGLFSTVLDSTPWVNWRIKKWTDASLEQHYVGAPFPETNCSTPKSWYLSKTICLFSMFFCCFSAAFIRS